MTQPAKVQEPSMEEILASIRRIIADDEAKPPAADKTPAAAVPAKTEKPEKPPAPAAAVKAPAANEFSRPPLAPRQPRPQGQPRRRKARASCGRTASAGRADATTGEQ